MIEKGHRFVVCNSSITNFKVGTGECVEFASGLVEAIKSHLGQYSTSSNSAKVQGLILIEWAIVGPSSIIFILRVHRSIVKLLSDSLYRVKYAYGVIRALDRRKQTSDPLQRTKPTKLQVQVDVNFVAGSVNNAQRNVLKLLRIELGRLKDKSSVRHACIESSIESTIKSLARLS